MQDGGVTGTDLRATQAQRTRAAIRAAADHYSTATDLRDLLPLLTPETP